MPVLLLCELASRDRTALILIVGGATAKMSLTIVLIGTITRETP